MDQLERLGFKLDFGEDGTGWQFKYLTRGGGYCFNVGCSDLIINGDIGLIQFDDIEEFVKEGALLNDDHIIPVNLIILATGYEGQEALIERLFGADVADRVGQVWGFGDGLELRNMYGQDAPAWTLVYCRQLRPMPDLLKISRAANQGI